MLESWSSSCFAETYIKETLFKEYGYIYWNKIVCFKAWDKFLLSECTTVLQAPPKCRIYKLERLRVSSRQGTTHGLSPLDSCYPVCGWHQGDGHPHYSYVVGGVVWLRRGGGWGWVTKEVGGWPRRGWLGWETSREARKRHN